MKNNVETFLLAACIALLISVAAIRQTPRTFDVAAATGTSAGDATPFHATGCDASLDAHVYHGARFKVGVGPADEKPRLQIIDPCTAAEGVIVWAKPEPDGDFHLRLKLDSAYASMLNPKNSAEAGDLVLELPCSAGVKVTQKDTLAEKVCQGWIEAVWNRRYMGEHVRVVGVYVTDEEHGWNELHPVTSISLVDTTEYLNFSRINHLRVGEPLEDLCSITNSTARCSRF